MPSDLDRVADDLYGLRPADFTAARDARAAEARKAGDRPLAAAIKALRRPTVGAWLANWLARQEAEQLDRLLQLGAAMRSAQDHLEGDQLRQLSRQRRQVVAALGARARRAAFDAGLNVGDGAVRELEAALNAALVDDEAADTLRSGRLTTAVQPAGLGPIEAVGPVALSRPSAPVSPRRHADEAARQAIEGEHRRGVEEAEADERRQRAAAEHRRQIESAEHAVLVALTSVAGARHEAEEHERLVAEARARHDQLFQQIRALQTQLNDLRATEAEAASTLHRREQSMAGADHAIEAADNHLDDLRRHLDQLRSSGPTATRSSD